MLYSHNAQLMTYTTSVYIATSYLENMLLNFLAYCRGQLKVKGCLYHLNTAKVDIFFSEKFVAKFSHLFFSFQVLFQPPI